MKEATESKYIFRAKDFYELLEKQGHRCPYSGRELLPTNCIAEHRLPLRKAGVHEAGNIVLVHQEVGYLKRYLTDSEVTELVRDMSETLLRNEGIKEKAKALPRRTVSRSLIPDILTEIEKVLKKLSS